MSVWPFRIFLMIILPENGGESFMVGRVVFEPEWVCIQTSSEIMLTGNAYFRLKVETSPAIPTFFTAKVSQICHVFS